jgi:hypothetical protein
MSCELIDNDVTARDNLWEVIVMQWVIIVGLAVDMAFNWQMWRLQKRMRDVMSSRQDRLAERIGLAVGMLNELKSKTVELAVLTREVKAACDDNGIYGDGGNR